MRAAATGQQVEVEGYTSPTRRVFANPDGSFTAEESVRAVRARRGGAWVPVDVTLQARTDGSVGPGAVPIGVAFSGGGSGSPLLRVDAQGASLALRWPTALPRPVLSGDTATYPEVLPGVDLKVRAGVDSVSQVLVVKSAAAAASPALRALSFGLQVGGGTAAVSVGGGLSVVDALGVEVLSGPRPVMWDSAGGVAAAAAAAAEGGTDDRTRGPLAGDRVAAMKLAVAAGAATVTPDLPMLTGASTRFPLYIDPVVAATKTAWAMVNKTFPSQDYWKWSGTEGVGWTDQEGVHQKHLLFQFDMAAVRGKTIRAATFTAFESFAHSCTPTPVELGVSGAFNQNTNWSNQPAWSRQIAVRTVAYGRDGCTPGGANVEFNAVSGVAEAALKGWPTLSLMMRAVNETTHDGWKRFANNASLSVDYNTPPYTPSGLHTTSPSTSCVRGGAVPAIPNDPPILVARLNDADGSKGQTVKAQFEVIRTAGGAFGTYDTASKLPGVDYQVQLPALTQGAYSWRARAYDGIVWSNYSGWCDFTVDLTKPASPTITPPADPDYAVGAKVPFTLGNGGSPDVARYRWSLNADAPTSGDVPAGSPTATVPLNRFGPNVLRVWSYDAAGNPSTAPASLDFRVTGGTPVGRWLLDEGTGTTIADAAGTHPLTLTGTSTWRTGRCWDTDPTDKAVSYNTASGTASTTVGVLPTDQNFSVATWVRLGTLEETKRRIVLSQDGTTASGFTLGIAPVATNPDGTTAPASFAFTVPDAGATTEASARWNQSIPIGEWIHLAGVYESGTHLLTLYVNGEVAASTTVPFTTTPSTGGLRVGRAKTAGNAAWFWLGDVDDVYAYDGALDQSQVNALFFDFRPH